MSFIYDVDKEEKGTTGREILGNFAMVADGFWGEGIFSDLMDVHICEKQIFFFHQVF